MMLSEKVSRSGNMIRKKSYRPSHRREESKITWIIAKWCLFIGFTLSLRAMLLTRDALTKITFIPLRLNYTPSASDELLRVGGRKQILLIWFRCHSTCVAYAGGRRDVNVSILSLKARSDGARAREITKKNKEWMWYLKKKWRLPCQTHVCIFFKLN